MECRERLEQYLREKGVPFEAMAHTQAYTMPEVAATLHVPGKQVAKVVVVKVGEGMIMLVIPASHRLNFASACLARCQEGQPGEGRQVRRPLPRLRDRGHAAVWQSLRRAGLCGSGPGGGNEGCIPRWHSPTQHKGRLRRLCTSGVAHGGRVRGAPLRSACLHWLADGRRGRHWQAGFAPF